MAKAVKKFMICDNPKCNSAHEDDEIAVVLGYYIQSGSVHQGGGGGPVAKVYACSEECLGPAVTAVFYEAYDAGHVRKKW